MKSFSVILGVLFTVFTMTAQAASPKPSGYLSDYDRLVEGEYLEAWWVDMPAIERSKSPVVLLGDISPIKVKDHKGVSVEEAIAWLKADLLAGATVSDAAGDTPYRIDLAISYMDPGSAAKRIWAGEFGAGHAQLQVEGIVTDVRNNTVVAEFAERRRSSGAIGIEDLGGDAGPHIIEHLVNLIADDIDSELRASFRVLE